MYIFFLFVIILFDDVDIFKVWYINLLKNFYLNYIIILFLKLINMKDYRIMVYLIKDMLWLYMYMLGV